MHDLLTNDDVDGYIRAMVAETVTYLDKVAEGLSSTELLLDLERLKLGYLAFLHQTTLAGWTDDEDEDA